nr:hypothetical protein KitaXyl93_01160 [Kitasatospora sp. Xyl93]
MPSPTAPTSSVTPATADAPDAADQDGWQAILDRIGALEARVHAVGSEVTAALDAHLARLDALRHRLAQPSWPGTGE